MLSVADIGAGTGATLGTGGVCGFGVTGVGGTMGRGCGSCAALVGAGSGAEMQGLAGAGSVTVVTSEVVSVGLTLHS